MRKAEFCVATEIVAEFSEALAETKLENSITGVTEDEEIIIEVIYERDEERQVEGLEELLSELEEGLEEDED